MEKFKKLRNIEGGHSDWQHRDFEYNCRNLTLYQVIVKVEEPEESLKKLNLLKGVQFKNNYTSSHWLNKTNENRNIFIGNLTFEDIKLNIGFPKSYGVFYNDDLKRRVTNLFYIDLQLYNYSYPY